MLDFPCRLECCLIVQSLPIYHVPKGRDDMVKKRLVLGVASRLY